MLVLFLKINKKLCSVVNQYMSDESYRVTRRAFQEAVDSIRALAVFDNSDMDTNSTPNQQQQQPKRTRVDDDDIIEIINIPVQGRCFTRGELQKMTQDAHKRRESIIDGFVDKYNTLTSKNATIGLCECDINLTDEEFAYCTSIIGRLTAAKVIPVFVKEKTIRVTWN